MATMTCKTCGHECDGECTNCGGMAEGDAACPICQRNERRIVVPNQIDSTKEK